VRRRRRRSCITFGHRHVLHVGGGAVLQLDHLAVHDLPVRKGLGVVLDVRRGAVRQRDGLQAHGVHALHRIAVWGKRCGRLQVLKREEKELLEDGRSCYGYLRIENAEGNVLIAVYLFICMRVIRIKKSFKPNRMKFGGMIGYYPGTI